jgi:hypothetical protein
VSAAAVLRRLHDAGVEVLFEQPDNIRLRGPLTAELVELARAAKPDLLALTRPTVQAVPCSCCGRFFYVEPATVCFWCRPRTDPRNSRKSPPESAEADTSATSAPAYLGPAEKRACPNCGGGLAHNDTGDGPCWSCRRVSGGAS